MIWQAVVFEIDIQFLAIWRPLSVCSEDFTSRADVAEVLSMKPITEIDIEIKFEVDIEIEIEIENEIKIEDGFA